MKTIQKSKQSVQQEGVRKAPKNGKSSSLKKSQEQESINNMVFSEYDVWPILAELHNHRN